MFRSFFFVLAIAACGGDDGGNNVQMDARPVDATVAKVFEVGCPATPAATVTTTNTVDAYSPMASTVSVGGIVKFALSSSHNAAPNTLTTSDPALTVDFGATKCLKFNATGTYGFFCTVHGFAGTITVQ